MDPADPLDAQQIVIEYARLVERDVEENRHPSRVSALPYAKPIIKAAIETSVKALEEAGQLTDDMREYFEAIYMFLAEYVDSELVDLMTEYRAAAEQLTTESLGKVRTETAAWRTLAESSSLAGDVARAVTEDAERLRREFHQVLLSL